MKLQEWTKSVSDELKAAGFEVSEWNGLPMAQPPKEHLECVRFLKFRTTLPADRRMYAEGTVFVPPELRGAF